VHPTLAVVGPWEPYDLPALMGFFVAIVWLWTWLEDRATGRPRRPWLIYFGEILLEAAVPTALTYAMVNRLGPMEIRSYGAMMLLGFIAGVTWVYLDRGRYGFSGRAALQVPLVGFAGGIVGGRIGFVLLQWRDYASHPEAMVNLWQGGMSWHGGLAGALIAMWITCLVMRISLARMMDLVSAPLALGYAIARVGCFLNGCCYGTPCTYAWAVTFPRYGLNPPPAVPVHPTQLYSILGNLAFVIPVVLLLTRFTRQPFSRFMLYVVLSSMVRFVVEYYRRGASAEIFGLLPVFTKAQAASLALIAVCGVAIIWREVAGRRREPAADDPRSGCS